MALDVPVLLITWQRPESTRRVLEHLRKARPRTLVLASDGPRHPGQMERIAATRELFADLPWECEVIRLFADFNMGLPWRITSAIDAAFERFDRLIVLEDDVLTDPSFFSFCEELLDRYADHDRIMMLRGTSYGFIPQHEPDASYVFTRFMSPWGWATWKRAWEGFDHAFFESRKARFLHLHPRLNRAREALKHFPSWPRIRHDPVLRQRLAECGDRYAFWLEACDRTLYTRSWAGLYALWLLECDGLVVTPSANLTHNIGFRKDAAHTKPGTRIPRTSKLESLAMPLVHPKVIEVHPQVQRLIAEHTDQHWLDGRRRFFRRFR